MGGYAWVTLATNDAYSLGALVLAHSLRRVGTKYELAVLVTPGVTQTMREKLAAVFSVVTEVNVLDSKDEANLALLARPELGITFTKLHCWRLTQYDKCVFLDADTLVVRNCDELFEREELSAAPDVGWPDCFNSGVFVYKPCQQTFASITAFAAAKGSFDGGDQGLLNMYFSDWAHKDISKHLPFIYNMCSTATYSYLPAFKQFGDDVRIIHFIGITKPWLQYFDTLTGIVQPPMGSAHLQPLLQLWWNIFCDKVHPQLSPVMATSTLAPIWHEFSPMPFQSPAPNNPIYTDTQDETQNETQNDIYIKTPDFSEFKDPWENYCIQNDPVINKKEDNKTEQYYSTIDRSSPATVLHNEFNCATSVHQTQQYNEYKSSSSHNQHHNQEQSNQFVNENRQDNSFFHSKNTSNAEVRSNHWQNEHRVENYAPVHSTQNHHSAESQQQHDHVNHQQMHQHSWNDGNNFKESNQYQHNDHQPNYQSFPERTREHHHHCHEVQHQYTYQDSPNNNNKSSSEETKQYHHNEHYVDHQHNQHHAYDNVNNKQDTQHHQENNQTNHFNEQREYECKQHESFNVTVHHEHVTENKVVAHSNDFSVETNTQHRENVNNTDEQTYTLMSTSPHPVSKPCTDIHNVATQSDPHITEDSSNAGLAGALAQMTLGEPRSAEQIALEEHMRKQSWEQGQIDYMGRDSFDNIWKKICQTLALAPSRLPSPPKEIETSEEIATDKTAESGESAELVDTIKPAESLDEVDKGAAQATSSHSEEQTLVNNVPITSDDNIKSKLSEKKSEQIIDTPVETNERTETVSEEMKDISRELLTQSESKSDDAIGEVSSTQDLVEAIKEILEEADKSSFLKETPQESTEKNVEVPQETTVPTVSSDLVQPCSEQKDELVCDKVSAVFVVPTEERETSATDATSLEVAVDVQQMEESDVGDEKHAKQLSTASEVFTTSPVPIQVAESVLQVELKESVSDSPAISEEVLASTITPVHESSALCSETLTEAKNEVQMNGSAAAIDSAQDKKELSLDIAQSPESIDVDKLSELSAQLTETLQVSSPVEQPQLTETPTLLSSITKSPETPDTSVDQSSQQTAEQKTEQVKEETKETESCAEETKESTEPSSLECAASEALPSTESPVRPSRAKELNVPSANVPETPSEEQKSIEKSGKKVASKSVEKLTSEGEVGETTEGDSTGKKVVKKVVKKVTKKPKSKPEEALDDGAQDSSSVSKPKKTVKVVKKGTKSSQTPDTEATLAEAPSSSASDAPIPPKRKSKAAPTKPSVKKSDVE